MKIIMAQLNFTVGDIDGNVSKILSEYHKFQADEGLFICSELAITGYYPQDLLLRSSLLNKQWEALEEIRKATIEKTCAILIGYAAKNRDRVGKPLHNALVVLHKGEVILEYYKQLLPTYNVFDEARHFSAKSSPNSFTLNGKRFGVMICEDAWFTEAKGAYLADPIDNLEGVPLDAVISINASPSNVGKQEERMNIAQNLVSRLNVPFIYVNQVGGNDELVFDGASFIMNRQGQLSASAKAFSEEVVAAEFEDNCVIEVSPLNRSHFILEQLQLGLRDYVNKCGFDKVVVGSSGGIDSAVTIALCRFALGAEKVKAITMPSQYSSKGSVNDSITLCKNLGVELFERPITQDFALTIKEFELMSKCKPNQITQENMQARIRGRILMEFSNHFSALVVSTGNKSEMSVGYATLYGDMNGGINPLGDLYKMDVYELAKFINMHYQSDVIPEAIITKAPSAELAEGQVDNDSLPAYPVLDAILKQYIEGDLLSKSEQDICSALLTEESVSDDLIAKIQDMVDRAEFKRKQAPPIIRVQKRSFGMGRWLPVAARYT